MKRAGGSLRRVELASRSIPDHHRPVVRARKSYFMSRTSLPHANCWWPEGQASARSGKRRCSACATARTRTATLCNCPIAETQFLAIAPQYLGGCRRATWWYSIGYPVYGELATPWANLSLASFALEAGDECVMQSQAFHGLLRVSHRPIPESGNTEFMPMCYRLSSEQFLCTAGTLGSVQHHRRTE